MNKNRKEREWQTCKLKRWGKKVGGMGVKVALSAVFYPNVKTLGIERSIGVQSLWGDN